MGKQFNFSFQTSRSIILIQTYDKDNKHFLLSALWAPTCVVVKNSTTLLIPDDSSEFTNSFKKNPCGPPGMLYTTPFSNLKFVPNFHKLVAGDVSSDMV